MAGIVASSVSLPIDADRSPSVLSIAVRPNAGAGVPAEKGSFAIVDNNVDPAERWQKIDNSSDTAWERIVDTTSSAATATIGHIDYGANEFNVDYLYDPDDTDSHDILQDAINALEPFGGGYIYIKTGVYSFNEMTTPVAGDYKIVGEGPNNTVIVDTADDNRIINIDGALHVEALKIGDDGQPIDVPIICVGGGDFIAKNLVLYIQSEGVTLDKPDPEAFCDFENIFFNGGNPPIVWEGSTSRYNTSVRNCIFYNCGALDMGGQSFAVHDTLFLSDGDDLNEDELVRISDGMDFNQRVIVSGCLFDAVDRDGVRFEGGTPQTYWNTMFENNVFDLGNSNDAFIIANGTLYGLDISRNQFVNVNTAINIVGGSAHGIIDGNRYTNVFGDFINSATTNPLRGQITGNAPSGVDLTGRRIYINASDELIISGNQNVNLELNNVSGQTATIVDNLIVASGTAYPLYLSGNWSAPLIANNRIRNTSNRPNILVNNAARARVVNNEIRAVQQTAVDITGDSAIATGNQIIRSGTSAGDVVNFAIGNNSNDWFVGNNNFSSSGSAQVLAFSIGTGVDNIRFIYNYLGGAVVDDDYDAEVIYGETTPNTWPGTNWGEGTYVP